MSNQKLAASVTLIILLSASAVLSQSCSECSTYFYKISGVDCVDPNYYQIISDVCETIDCAQRCLQTSSCQAFSINTASCQCKLFVFDKCSHRVQSVATCINQVSVYVRSIAGVPQGRLCPTGYANTRYGTSYRIVTYEGVPWSSVKQKCLDPGLSKVVDAIDAIEVQYLQSLKQSISGTTATYWLGGQQNAGAANATENWFWADCNLPVSKTGLWAPGKPSLGMAGNQGCIGFFATTTIGMDDYVCGNHARYICECQSVF